MNNNLFGTDGIRTKVGNKPLTTKSLIILAQAISLWIKQKYKKKINILLGNDPRQSSNFIKNALKTGFLLSDIFLYDAEIIPTPALYAIMKDTKKYDLGIMISASHNLYQDNGIKIFSLKFGKLTQEDELQISHLFATLQNDNIYNYSSFGQSYYIPNALTLYKNIIKKYFSPNLLQSKKIVLDCAHGATSIVAPQIFKELGATVISINNEPNGLNINKNCGTTSPKQLQAAVINYDAHIGFAFDGDGDRVCVINHKGIHKDGDDILSLLSQHKTYKNESIIVGTIMSNEGLNNYFKQNNKTLIRTNVGDKNIAKELQKKNITLGGEPSGHIICNDYLSMGDGIFTALKIMETVNQTNNIELITFKKFPQILINLPIEKKINLNSSPIANIITNYKMQLTSGRLIIRYSGTQPILRIMIEEKNYNNAKIIGKNISYALQKEL